jgi:uncharacterized protein (AIM24 family)
MSNHWGSGSYVGVPVQRTGGGFGRRGISDAEQPTAASAEAFTLSTAAQDFIAQERARNAQALAEADAASTAAALSPAAEAPLVNDVDFSIGGTDNQYVEIELDPGEAVVAEIGTMIWKDRVICFEAILGDGKDRGVLSTLVSAGTNALSGEALFMGEFRHCGSEGKARVGFGGRSAGHILPIRLEAMGGTLICQKGAFLAAAKGIAVSVQTVSSFWTGIAGGAGFILQRLSGTGWAFIHVGGSLIERTLGPGEVIHVEPGCIAAFEPAVQFDTDELLMPGGGIGSHTFRELKANIAGVRNTECARLTGPGKVWLQSLQPPRELTAASIGAISVGSVLGEKAAHQISSVGMSDTFDAAMKLLSK